MGHDHLRAQGPNVVSAMRFFTAMRGSTDEFTEPRFLRMVQKLTNIALTPEVGRILFYALDLDGSGGLDWSEVQAIMGARSSANVDHARERQTFWQCIRGCARPKG